MATEKRLDLVEREAVKDAIGFMNLHFLGHGEDKSVLDSINEVPSVDSVEVVHGEWIHCQGKSNLWYCSACGEKILYNPTRRTYNIAKRPVHEVNKYCRGCGAKMDGERKNSEID